MIEDLLDRLRLLRTPGIGPVTYRQLIARFGTPKAGGDPSVRKPCPIRTNPYEPQSEEVNGDDALDMVQELLGHSPVPVDEIICLSGAPSGAVQMACLNSILPDASTGMRGTGSAFDPLDGTNRASPPYAYA